MDVNENIKNCTRTHRASVWFLIQKNLIYKYKYTYIFQFSKDSNPFRLIRTLGLTAVKFKYWLF